MPGTTIGPLFDAGQLEADVIAALKTGLPHYLRHVESLTGHATLAPVKSWAVISEYDRFPEDGLPALIVAAPGLVEEPDRDGEGFYTATWSLEVSVTVGGQNPKQTRRVSQLYAAAVRGAMLQLPIPNADVKRWLDETYDDVPTAKRRSILATSNVFAVEVTDVVTDQGRYTADGEWPTADTVQTETEKRER